MKKKLFLGALLLGALTLNSCVDNVESDSVKAVRQAKAEQLKATADLDKATAEAKLISANAEKAAQEALAEYRKAEAEKMKAEAEYQKALAALRNAEAESAKVAAAKAAEQAKLDLEEAQARLELAKQEIAKTAAQYEAELYTQQLEALKAKKAYEDAVKNADKVEIAALMEAYQDAADNLLVGQKALAMFKLSLAKLEAGLETPDYNAQSQINWFNNENNRLQTEIDAAQAYINAIRDESYAEAEADLPEAQKTLDALKATVTEKTTAQSAASATASNATNALVNSDYANAAVQVAGLGQYIFQYSENNYDYQLDVIRASSDADPEVQNKICAVVYTKTWVDNGGWWTQQTINTDYIPLFSTVNAEWKPFSYTYSYKDQYGVDQTYTYNNSYRYYNSYYNLVAGGMDKFVSAAKTFVANGVQKSFDNAKKAYDDQAKVVTPLQTLYDNLASLKATYDDKVKTLNEALRKDPNADSDGKLQKAVDDALLDFNKALKGTDYEGQGLPALSNCENDLNREKGTLNTLLSNKNSIENTLNLANEEVAKFEGYAKTLNSGAEANTAAIKAYNEASAATCQADADLNEANTLANIQQSVVNALNNIITAGAPADIDPWNQNKAYLIQQKEQEIADMESQIEYNNSQIAMYEKDIESGKLNQQLQIDNLKADIANQEAKNVVLENKVKEAKAELDAALGEPEETPVE